LGSGILKKPIPDPGTRGEKGTGSRIQILNTDYTTTLFSKKKRKEIASFNFV
jgi:hypothetical protein